MKIYSTTVLTDIRNFTGLFEKFQYEDSDSFIILLEKYYKIQYDLSHIISDDVHLGSTGDGILTIFKSKNNHLEGYAYLLVVHRALSKIFGEFENKNNIKTSFGIAADSGYIWDIGKNMNVQLDTYVGTVINRTSRIEANTKLFGKTKAAIGYYLYNKLFEELYPSVYNQMKNFDKNYEELLITNPDIVMMSEKMMLFYIFEMILKNINKPLPIFRLSEYLVKDDKYYWNFINTLIGKEKTYKIKEYLKKED